MANDAQNMSLNDLFNPINQSRPPGVEDGIEHQHISNYMYNHLATEIADQMEQNNGQTKKLFGKLC